MGFSCVLTKRSRRFFGRLKPITGGSGIALLRRDDACSTGRRDHLQVWKVEIVFSHLRRQQPVSEEIPELSYFIQHNPAGFSEDPTSLVGKRISHKFVMEDTREVKWFNGKVISYDPATKTHEIAYEDEDDHCNFDVMLDLYNNDLSVLT